MSAVRTLGLFAAAALAELTGVYLVWLGIREHRGVLFVALGVGALASYAVAQAFQPDPHFGRVFAAYGGVFVVGAIVWAVVVDGFRPDRSDIVGAAICLAGMAVIMFGPRA